MEAVELGESYHLGASVAVCRSSIYSPLQLGDPQFQSLRISTVIGARLVHSCCVVLYAQDFHCDRSTWLINLFSLSVCGFDSSVALTEDRNSPL